MRKLIAICVVGLVTAGTFLATPTATLAHQPFGVSVNWGGGYGNYYRGGPNFYGNNHAPRCSPYNPGYPAYVNPYVAPNVYGPAYYAPPLAYPNPNSFSFRLRF